MNWLIDLYMHSLVRRWQRVLSAFDHRMHSCCTKDLLMMTIYSEFSYGQHISPNFCVLFL